MQNRLVHYIPWIVFIIALILLIIHLSAWQGITIDNTALVLLAVLLLSPVAERITRIKVGTFEAEIATDEVMKVKKETERRLEVSEANEIATAKVKTLRDDFNDLLEKDYVLALAKLRMEFEQALNRLYKTSVHNTKQERQLGINRIVAKLIQAEVLPNQLSKPIQDVISLCNRAIHGESVRFEDARSIVDVGIQILEQINLATEDLVITPKDTKQISQAELETYMDAKYRVSTVIPYVKNPVLNTRILDQEGVGKFLEGYEEYAEFLVGIERVDNETIQE